jgi:hypothetical protein
VDVLVAGIANTVCEGFAGNAGDGSFAGRVDIGKNENVRLIESTRKIVPKMLGTGIAVRLEKYEKAVELAATSSLEGGADFSGVMTVVVHNHDVVDDALDVEAAADATKFCQAFAD